MKSWGIFLAGFAAGLGTAVLIIMIWFAVRLYSRLGYFGRADSGRTGRNAAMTTTKPQGDPAVGALLASARATYKVPAMGAAIVGPNGVTRLAVDGVRKAGAPAEVTPGDFWHLGSDTKAMTAAMIAALVEQGKLSWDTRLGRIFPKLALPVAV